MTTAYVVVAAVAVAANAFSGAGALARLAPVLPGMDRLGVPRSWLPALGVLKLAGAAGLLLGLAGVPGIGTAAAVGLVLYFLGALGFHVRARDFGAQFGLAAGFTGLALATLLLGTAG